MTTSTINNKIEIIADIDEELKIFRDTVYPDRIIVFKTIEPDILQEFHFDKSTGQLLDREKRRMSLPKFEYSFDNHKIVGIVEHKFLDELDFNGFKPKGIDIETITVKLFENGQEVKTAFHMHPVNQFSKEHYDTVKDTVDRFIENAKAENENLIFLRETYSKWSSEKKANYHYGQILFQDRMQGGYPSIYKNPAADYLSKWFIDTFQKYDNNIFHTLELIAKSFAIDTIHLQEMVKYDTKSDNWKKFAEELELLT